jgi:hypothetical protein
MPVNNKEKNREYVAKHRAKKQASDKEAYNKVNAGYIESHRKVLKEKIGEDAYKKQQAEYMKQYRASKKQIKTQIEQKQKSINTLTDAIKARKARQELLSRAVAKANETALLLEEQSNKARLVLNNAKTSLNQPKPTEKRKRGRPAKK